MKLLRKVIPVLNISRFQMMKESSYTASLTAPNKFTPNFFRHFRNNFDQKSICLRRNSVRKSSKTFSTSARKFSMEENAGGRVLLSPQK